MVSNSWYRLAPGSRSVGGMGGSRSASSGSSVRSVPAPAGSASGHGSAESDACRRTSVNGWYGTTESSSQRPNSTVAPAACARVANSAARPVLPIPGSPASRTRDRGGGCSRCAWSCCRISSRPTKAVGRDWRTTDGSTTADSGSLHRRRCRCQGSANPLRTCSPTSSKTISGPVPRSCRVTSERRISAPSARPAMRAAALTACPWTSPSSTMTSPTLTPTRTRRSSPSSAARARCRATTQSRARRTDAKASRKPSPRPLTRNPPCSLTSAVTSSSCRRICLRAAWSPCAVVRDVDPTTSVTTIVSGPS